MSAETCIWCGSHEPVKVDPEGDGCCARCLPLLETDGCCGYCGELDPHMAQTTTSLPRIVRFTGTSDSPGSSCPHCGATGRYILRFVTEDGRHMGAMRGCVQLFPCSRVAHEELRLRQKLEQYQKRGWNGLNRRDTEALDAIEQFYAGTRDERSTLSVIDGAKRANSARYGR